MKSKFYMFILLTILVLFPTQIVSGQLYNVEIVLDKTEYFQGQKVRITVCAYENGSPVENIFLKVLIFNPNKELKDELSVFLSKGCGSTQYVIPSSALPGIWTVEVRDLEGRFLAIKRFTLNRKLISITKIWYPSKIYTTVDKIDISLHVLLLTNETFTGKVDVTVAGFNTSITLSAPLNISGKPGDKFVLKLSSIGIEIPISSLNPGNYTLNIRISHNESLILNHTGLITIIPPDVLVETQTQRIEQEYGSQASATLLVRNNLSTKFNLTILWEIIKGNRRIISGELTEDIPAKKSKNVTMRIPPLENVGSYTMVINAFGDDTMVFSTTIIIENIGALQIVNAPEEAYTGETYTMQVLDQNGKPVPANISIKRPDGTIEFKEAAETGEFQFIPITPGDYKVTASGDYYKETIVIVEVLEKPVETTPSPSPPPTSTQPPVGREINKLLIVVPIVIVAAVIAIFMYIKKMKEEKIEEVLEEVAKV